MPDDTVADLQMAYDEAVALHGSESVAARVALGALNDYLGEPMSLTPAALTAPMVYQAINAVQAELAVTGIGKDRRNQQQGFAFRGIDDVFNSVTPVIAKHHLCILPRMVARTVEERTAKSGGVLFSVTVEAEFDFVSALDGSRHVIRTFGEGMDSGDKATNKAMSAAYKYAVIQGFGIPTEGDNDPDATTHDVAPGAMAGALRAIANAANMDVLKAHFQAAYLMLPAGQRTQLEAAKDKRKRELEGVPS